MAKLTAADIRLRAESDLEAFIRLVAPNRLLGHIHKEIIRWWNRPNAGTHQLLLLPRDHQKSALVAFRVAWEITRNPAIRVLYISSTSNLAQKQLGFIKQILTSDEYRKYWPEMVNLDESKREKWTESEISVDHPLRKQRMVRDPTVFTAGLTTGIVGMHCDIGVLDDVVVHDNAKDELGRARVRTQASYLTSICGTNSQIWAVGTRYHPRDLYNDFIEAVVEIYGEDGEIIESSHLYECFEKAVEDRGDGSGNYLWPKQKDIDGIWRGFDQKELAKKKAGYHDLTQFRAQYYNNPNEVGSASIGLEHFQYYDKQRLHLQGSRWHFKDTPLNVFAAVDFAYSVNPEADFTCIVVIGVDSSNNYYILDIERFKTKKISEYFEKILKLHTKWKFRKLRAEVTAAQDIIVQDLKENYIRAHGLALSIDEHRPDKKKEDRIEATLQPRYHNLQVWHYKGGNCELLEEELLNTRPPHDDIKDALTSVVEIAVPPTFSRSIGPSETSSYFDNPGYHSRFGGYG